MLLHADAGGHRPRHVHAVNALFARPGRRQVELAQSQYADDGAAHPSGLLALLEGFAAHGIDHNVKTLATGVLLNVLSNRHVAVVDGDISPQLA